MKITISGSLGNIGKPLTQQLVAAGHEVTVISSEAARQPAIEALGAKAAIGSVADAHFLTQAISGADALFAMTPPNMGDADIVANTAAAGQAYADAIKASGLKRVVMLSSVGADYPEGTGPIRGLHLIEGIYSGLEDVAITYLRAGYFYTNFFNDVPMIQTAGIMGGNFPAAKSLPLVHPEDIATLAAEELTQPSTGKKVRYAVSDVRTPADVAQVLGAAAGKPELPWVEFTDEQSLQGMTGAGLPGEMAGLYTEMGTAIRAGKLQADFTAQGAPVAGKIKLEDFARDFAAKF
ncbi:NAD(P)H-binding protein [Taibaiella chishuiensis]|uniref:Uncharacterized protein YbjT (DUF2867 family) n=1 Tax=Taibaiella chishuiensis TaxID=1434707 RepID=A0A2P8CR51_9BACT|nr:NAD(P)H-binding protein [Taibaiella chishuiensis]PSK87430.1 uncharacterized protein YbjT (DUF2867 family) [Taibaiella chishuiensis]